MSHCHTHENGKPKQTYREIITKAVCGTAKKNINFEKEIFLRGHNIPEKILGSKITKFKINPITNEAMSHRQPEVHINGALEVNIWYSFNKGRSTDVLREILKFEETLPVSDFDPYTKHEIATRVMITRFPECKQIIIKSKNSLLVTVELSVHAEIIGETKLYVQMTDHEDDDS